MSANTAPLTRSQNILPDSPGFTERLSYIHSDAGRTRKDSLEVPEKYDTKDHTRNLEHASQDDFDHITQFPNKWAEIRPLIRQPAAEFLGTMILVIFGTGVNCQVVLSSSTAVSSSVKGQYLSISFGWAVGLALGAWVSGGVSGGHINPAVTIAQAIFRGFSWKKVPSYILAQVLGACTGAGIVYANYHRAIDLFEGGLGVRTIGTASLFGTFGMDYLSNFQCFCSEALGTAILLLVLLAVTDKRNGPPPSGLVPLVLFITLLGESASLGMHTGFALNPARDLGPRLMCWMAGYGRQVWNYRSQYWLYTPIIGPIVGAILGTMIYDAFIFTGSESIFNKPSAAARRRHLHTPAEV
ncbi:putative membrane protein YFL054C [Saccharomyces cerevisiae S288c] [Rhizoctonia solani]|uniref:Putative membrane protein YFL054C [Saccharomyces cerevisiae S288c] n=1 Tax=Rhizoctonia solani TaxID=456999 RepID=A0A0K6G9V0_9AGAM|nr:putative membrane protein YFL054C [Saccharomyces cerevisiae S288c] [Rhizoctonia solani]